MGIRGGIAVLTYGDTPMIRPRRPHGSPTRVLRALHPARSGRAFTVVELLVVIAIIAALIALLIPSMSSIRNTARTAKCLSNQRQIAQASISYTTANAGRFVSPHTNPDLTVFQWNAGSGTPTQGQSLYTLQHAWVYDRNPPAGNPDPYMVVDTTNPSVKQERPRALTDGKLYSYLGSESVYLSPNEPTNSIGQGADGALGQRIRSYSINSFVGVRTPDDTEGVNGDRRFVSYPGQLNMPLESFNTTTLARIVQPARTMYTTVEGDNPACANTSTTQGANYGGWIISPVTANWVDTPAIWNPDAITMSYVDGSTGQYALQNKDLVEIFCAQPHFYDQPADGDIGFAVDWKYFRDRLLPGVIPNSNYGFGE